MKIRVTGSEIKIVQKELMVTEAINAYVIKFQFDKSWNEMINKTAVFYQPKVNRDNPIYMLISEKNEVYVPAESLVADDFLYIGVFGFTMDGVVRLPTVYTYTYVERGCFKLSSSPIPPISVYEEIYSMALKAWMTAQEVARKAEEGGFDGFSPTVTVKESTVDSYVLTITTKDGSFDTPNLLGLGYVPEDTYVKQDQLVDEVKKQVNDYAEQELPSVITDEVKVVCGEELPKMVEESVEKAVEYIRF